MKPSGTLLLVWLQVALDEHVTVGTAPITSPNLAEPSAASNELHSLPYTLPGCAPMAAVHASSPVAFASSLQWFSRSLHTLDA
eukprot:1141699-Pelagomonas_calceolata.AAC.1